MPAHERQCDNIIRVLCGGSGERPAVCLQERAPRTAYDAKKQSGGFLLRWGILANLAVILTVSGLVLFLVFSASIKRAAIDAKIQDSNVPSPTSLRIRSSKQNRPEKLWERVRSVCGGRTRFKAGSVRGRWKGPGRVRSQPGIGAAFAIRNSSQSAGHRSRIGPGFSSRT